MSDELINWLRDRIAQTEREQAEAWEQMGAGFNVENEDILTRFFDDVKARVAG